jgi:serine/threonine protein kinase/formylglycine-generating enzyme required for sulfatase activity
MVDGPTPTPTPTPVPTPVPTPPGSQPAGERVQSTATGELLQKLATAPKLDGERFTLEGELGKGGMGVVLRVHDQFLNRRLAMKVLLERGTPRDEEEKRLVYQLLGRFLEEAQVTSQLDHPGVVPVHELGLDQSGKVFFTMRMVKGKTASERFADAYHQRNEWDLTRGLEVILKVCDTMSYAHDKGVLHRDLKPGNVMVGRFGEVYVMDWGLAKVLGQQDRHDLRIRADITIGVSRLETARKRDAETDADNSVVSMDGQQFGTPSYMSPEQARSEELDARADVYSIGAMLYELVTGSAPYAPRGLRKPAYRILEDVVQRPPERVEVLNKAVPAELVAVIDKAMAREREQRYRSVQALAADVRAFLAQRVVTAYRTGAWQETKLWVRRNKPLAASLAAAAVLLVGGIAVAVSFGAAEAKAKQAALLEQQRAERNAEAAEQARQRADAKVAEFDQLALVVDYERLRKEEPELVTAYPEQADAIADWLQRAQRLLGLKDELAAVVAAVQQSVGSEATNASAQFLAQSLGDLLGKLPKLAELVPAMQQRQRWSQAIGPLTLAHPNARATWAEARAAVAASPKYAGQDIPLRDRDVVGLVPIGANPQSGLWEFYDLRSAWDGAGDPAVLPIPTQAADGRIAMTGASGIVWVLLPGGTLPAGTVDDGNEQKTSVRLGVRLDPFLLAKYELTQGQWQRWTGDNPAQPKDRNDLSLPVETVSWLTCRDMLQRFGLMLPSELQWEYGTRGGTTTAWWTGDDREALLAAENIGGKDAKLLPVGSKSANPFGLFDMGGNVWEWCYDEREDYGTERAGDGRRPDPTNGPLSRCFRGGGFGFGPGYARSGYRYGFGASFRIDVGLGARPARTSRR